MNRSKQIGMCIVLLLMIMLFTNQALALGVTPGKKIIEFEPKLRTEKTISIINSDYKEFRAAILVQGELAPYITLSQNSVDFSANEGEKLISYELFLPSTLDDPGMHEAEIVIREIPKTQTAGEIEIGALLAVASKVQVRVPYPGKYAQAEIDIISDTEDVSFIVRAINLGEQDIDEAKAVIYIYDTDNNLITALNTATQDLKTKQRKELIANWKAEVPFGNYKATVVFDYDGVAETINKEFTIGNFFIRPIDLSVDNFRLGGVAKFDLLVENIANKQVSGFAAEMEMLDQDFNEIAIIKSVPDTIPAGTQKEINLFWPTEGIEPGMYRGKLTMSYQDKSMTRDIRFNVQKDRIEAEIVGITGMVVAPQTQQPSETEGSFMMGMLVMAVIVLALAVIILGILYFRKKS